MSNHDKRERRWNSAGHAIGGVFEILGEVIGWVFSALLELLSGL
jgi:hypothetical protein